MSNLPNELPVGGMMPMTEPIGSGAVVAQSGLDILRVLLVDDNAHVLQFLTSAFKMHNCLVSTAATAEQALDLLADTVFDLIVSDIKMPGLSGLDLLRAVKGKQPGTPVVLMTGVPSINSAVFGLRHGAYLRHDDGRMSNLFLSILHSLGIEEPAFGDSTGTLTGSIFRV